MQLEMLYSLRRFKAAQQVLGFLCTYLLPNLISVDMNGYALAPRDREWFGPLPPSDCVSVFVSLCVVERAYLSIPATIQRTTPG